MSERTTASKLKSRCNSLRQQLGAYPEISQEELKDVWPGGKENPSRGFAGWIECYAQLLRLTGMVFRKEPEGGGEELEAVVRAASSRTPTQVILSVGNHAVYPKSAHSLAFLDSLEAVQRPLIRLMVDRAQDETLSPNEVDALLPLSRSLAQRTWAWVLLSPGVGLPFDDNAPLDPPEWTAELLPEDYLAIYFAHRELHAHSVAIMSAALPKEGGAVQSRLSLSGFLTGYAAEHGLPPSQLMRHWSLPEAVAAAVAASEAHRVAEANANNKRPRGADL